MVLLKRFCECYSLRAGICILAVADMLISGALICDFRLQLPGQINAFRRLAIYDWNKLKLLELNAEIAMWVLVADIFFVSFMLIPPSFANSSTPIKTRRSIRNILIPCILERMLSIMHSIAAIVWLPIVFSVTCAEIVGIMLAIGLRILLGIYLIIIAISYYQDLGLLKFVYKEGARNELLAKHKQSNRREERNETATLSYSHPVKSNLHSDATDYQDSSRRRQKTTQQIEGNKKYENDDDKGYPPRERNYKEIKDRAREEKERHLYHPKYQEEQEAFSDQRQNKPYQEDARYHGHQPRARRYADEERQKAYRTSKEVTSPRPIQNDPEEMRYAAKPRHDSQDRFDFKSPRPSHPPPYVQHKNEESLETGLYTVV